MSQTLPPVASSFYTLCKKCEVERYHKVITHSSSTSAKLQCEVCKKNSTYKLPDLNKSVKTTSKSPRLSTQKIAAAKIQYNDEYSQLKNKSDESKAKAYNMKALFQESELIKHPKFGLGFVKAVIGDKIQVYFEDESRFLIHNRQ